VEREEFEGASCDVLFLAVLNVGRSQ
jgi:hypothetical protein